MEAKHIQFVLRALDEEKLKQMHERNAVGADQKRLSLSMEVNGGFLTSPKKVSGTLRFSSNEGAILDLIGSFKDIKDIKEVLNPDVILGVSSDGKNITLYKCFEITSKVSLPGLLTSSIYANVVIVGVHFEKIEDIIFDSLSIHYSHLDNWANRSIAFYERHYFSKNIKTNVIHSTIFAMGISLLSISSVYMSHRFEEVSLPSNGGVTWLFSILRTVSFLASAPLVTYSISKLAKRY